MTAPLRLTLHRDNDGTGELSAEVHVNSFSGVGAAWFNIDEIAHFGQTLTKSYPLLSERTYELKGGYWSSAAPGKIEHIHLGIWFYPVGSLGKVGCRVQLANQLETASPAPEYAVTVELRTQYEQLRQFGLALVALAEGTGNEAVLLATGA